MHRFRGVLATLVLVAASAGIGVAGMGAHSAAGQESGRERQATAVMFNQSGEEVGTVTFEPEPGGLRIRADVAGLTPGFHGFHIHAIGNCDAASAFMSAGGHLNMMGMTHADHTGDMPSLYVMADGTSSARNLTDRFTISDLLADGGRAVIIHAEPDNFANIPARYGVTPDQMTLDTGDAGARFACGVVQGM